MGRTVVFSMNDGSTSCDETCCYRECIACTEGFGPAKFKVTASGIICSAAGGVYSCDCSVANGTFILSHSAEASSPSSCVWEYIRPGLINCTDPDGGNVNEDAQLVYRIHLLGGISHEIRFELEQRMVNSTHPTQEYNKVWYNWKKSYAGNIDCLTLTDELINGSFSVNKNAVIDQLLNVAGAKISLTSLAA